MIKRHTFIRMALVLLAAAIVIAITWAAFPPLDAAHRLAEEELAAKGQMPSPHAEAVLRRAIAKPPPRRPRPGTDVSRLGPLQSVSYLGVLPNPLLLIGLGQRIDSFRTNYQNGTLIWLIGLDHKGAANVVSYFNPEPMTSLQVVQLFSKRSGSEAALDVAVQLVILLLIALAGRLLLRIRL